LYLFGFAPIDFDAGFFDGGAVDVEFGNSEVAG
jgi:hypothetical protein